MNRFTRLTGAMAVALGIALSAPAPLTGPALAGGDPPANTWLTCEGLPTTTGTITGYHAFSYDEAAHVWRSYVTGLVYPCQPPGPHHVFAVAAYDNTGASPGWALRYPESTDFYGYVKVNADTVAVCVIRSVKDRLDCIKIDWIPQDTGPPQPVAGPHIPADSPSVAIDAKVDLSRVYGVDPGCPTCVDD